MSHAELVKLACVWLKRQRCVVILPEARHNATIEIPDAIGWTYDGRSLVVECKASRADFLADKKKPHRQFGMGTFRYFLAPKGILFQSDFPGPFDSQPCSWGWIEPRGSKFKVMLHSESHLRDCTSETKLLVSQLRFAT